MNEDSLLRGTLIKKSSTAAIETASNSGIENESGPKLTGSLMRKQGELSQAESREEVTMEPNTENSEYKRYFRLEPTPILTKEEIEAGTQKQFNLFMETIQPLKELYGSYEAILSGESRLGDPSGQHVLSSSHLKESRGYKVGGIKNSFLFPFHTVYFTGRDLEWLRDKFPEHRYKFYLSLDMTTDKQREKGREFSSELLKICSEGELSISTKSYDHNYDSFNIYTWDQEEMAETLTGLYVKYERSGIFNSVAHFYQGSLPGVSDRAIGYVQEPPSNGLTTRSHSGRMGLIGEYFDALEKVGKAITIEDYTQACKKAGVRPEMPWLLENENLIDEER